MRYPKETDILLSYVSTKMDTAAPFQFVVDFFWNHRCRPGLRVLFVSHVQKIRQLFLQCGVVPATVRFLLTQLFCASLSVILIRSRVIKSEINSAHRRQTELQLSVVLAREQILHGGCCSVFPLAVFLV